MHILNSWKEIANYLGRGVRTVQRWERDLGLPVHRPKGKDRSAVLAFPQELDNWLRQTPVRSTELLSIPQVVKPEVVADQSKRDYSILIEHVRSTSRRSQMLMESLVQTAGRHQALTASLCSTLTKMTRRRADTSAA